MTQTLTAEQLFRKAYENRYTWDENFPGYSCDVVLKTPDATHTAKAKIGSDLKFEVYDIDDTSAKKAIEQQMWEITIHRVNHSFEKSHGDNTFEFGNKKENDAVEILVGGASAGNRYEVKDDVVTLVYRKIGGSFVCINTFEVLNTDNGYLSTGYDSVYFDAETAQPKGNKTIFRDTFEKVGNYYILTHRQITTENDGQPTITEYQFSNVTLA